MSSAPAHLISFDRLAQIREARSILRHEAKAIEQLAECVDSSFCDALDIVRDCRGAVITTGVGKAGLIGQKVAATLSSTGTRSHFMHPTEAVHGDLGCIHSDDVVLAFSNSGETEEVCRLMPLLERLQVPVISITASDRSTLGRSSTVVLELGRLREAGSLQLAPTTSTTAMIAVGDALALTVSQVRGFTPSDFAVFHPAGSLGQKLTSVSDIMRCGDELRVACETDIVRDVLAETETSGRRTGAVILTDSDGRLTGLFTDSDLARLLAARRDDLLDQPIRKSMTCQPATLLENASLNDALELLSVRKLSELPIIDEDGCPVGMVDITDVIGLVPDEVNPS